MTPLHWRFKNASIKTKLQVVNVMTTGLALLLALIFLLGNEFMFYRQNLTDNLSVQAKMIATNSTAAVVFKDRKAANEILAALQASPEIIQATILLPDNTVFASFSQPATLRPGVVGRFVIRTGYFPTKLHLLRDIDLGDEKIASLSIEADMQGLYQTIERYAQITAFSAITALAVSLLLLRGLRKSITQPLTVLTHLMRIVTRNKDFSLRARSDSHDEVGSLSRCFNEMLEQIQKRDDDLSTELLERKRAEERLDLLAYYDTVTGLPNRHFFNERLAHAIAKATPFGECTALMFIDLDNFKIINDTLGHDVGDMLLNGVGERLAGALRSRDFIFRVGGDEFAVILEDVGTRDHISGVAEKVIHVFSEPLQLNDHEIFVSASIGVSLAPDDATDTATLLKNADTAMYYAKERGKNTYQLFQPEMKSKVLHRMNLENSLRRGLERREFVLHYQPQFDLNTNTVLGAEALVRWQHPERGMISPAEFIPVAEECGLIVPLGEWVLRTACAQAAHWEADGLGALTIAVNLSGRQFKDDNLVEKVIQIVWETGLDAHLLELELTESTLMDASRSNMRKLTLLKAAGIRFSIDDFGTGYSSMNYLKRFPISKLKIDRSFVDGIPDNQEDTGITSAIIALAQSLKMDVIAEGVETDEQAGFLRAKGCGNVQGFLISQPLPAEEFESFLRKYNDRPGNA